MNDATFIATLATRAAYTQGKEWHRQMLAYVQANIDYVAEELPRYIPLIRVPKPDASFLVWLDGRDLKEVGVNNVPNFFVEAGLALNDGTMFGEGGEGFMRLNVGCPRSLLERALEQLYNKYRTLIS